MLRKFVKNELDLEDNAVTALVVQRVHRLGRPAPGRTRPLIAAFRDTTYIETLMKAGRNKLTNTNFRNRDLPDKIRQARGRFWPQLQQVKTDGKTYPAKPSYSHCAELGRSDCHFSTAARVKKTVTPPTYKTVTVLAIVS